MESETQQSSSSTSTVEDVLKAELLKEREEKSQLLKKIGDLEKRIAELERVSLPSELDSLVNPSNAAYHGPDSIVYYRAFDIDSVITEFTQQAPNLYAEHIMNLFIF